MKRIILFFVVAMLVGAGVAWAAAYEMVLNKDEKLCPAMLKLVNEDLKRYKEIRYDTHEEFTAIKWEPTDAMFGEKFKDDICSINRMARFDMNNDGREEIVVKLRMCFKSQLTDSIYFFNRDDPAFPKHTELEDMLTNSSGSFMSIDVSRSYRLKQLPPREEKFGAKIYEGVGGWMILNPFLYQGTYYLAVTDSDGYGFVIGKYKKREELDDLCYFRVKETKDAKVKPPKKGQR